jgi:hypothetical protein
VAKTLPDDHEAYREFIDQLTGDRCRRGPIVDIKSDLRPKLSGRICQVRLMYVERGIGSGRVLPLSVVVDIGVLGEDIWRREFRIDLLEHDCEFTHIASCLDAEPQTLADLIRANAPR